MVREIIRWIGDHRRLVFFHLPLLVGLLLLAYTGIVYLSWRGDREKALDKLYRYKTLIDRTEEIKAGYEYSYSDVDLNAKVVDIPTRIYDRNDEIIGEFFEQKREIVPYGHIPKWLVNSVIASEDREFYRHRGISYKGIVRALLVNVAHLGVVQGGSTITQQLAKVLFTDMARSLKRKIYETFCALEIERRYDKQDILSMYLNLIYFGNGAYGVESAAKMFFGLSVKDLNETECAMIVATISNPLIYSPLSNLANSVSKTKRIMKSLVDAGYISRGRADYQFSRFLSKWDVKVDRDGRPAASLIGSFLMSSYKVNRAPLFNEGIRRVLVEKFTEEVVKKGGLSVYTTIDAAAQDVALRVLQKGVLDQRDYQLKIAEKYRGRRKYEEMRENVSGIEGALLAINPYTGEIKAHVGGYSFSSQNQVDHVSQVYRQPGSSFKPVIYAAALEGRDITPSTIFLDERTVFSGGYSPRNFDDSYAGKVTARDALSRSINVVAVKVLEKTGYAIVFRMLKEGLDLSERDLHRRFGKTLSLALGAYELSPQENAVLHSVIVNGGDYVRPYGIRQVKDYNGNIVWDNEEEVRRAVDEKRAGAGKIMDPAACAITVSMLKGVFEEGGTAHFAVKGRKINFPIAGKTGTTSNFSDAWFIGYTPELVTAVWVGNKKGAISLGAGRAGGVISANIWADFIAQAPHGNEPGDFPVPDEGLTRQTICLDSGLVPRAEGLCPRVSRDELFYPGSEPGEYCPIHAAAQ